MTDVPQNPRSRDLDLLHRILAEAMQRRASDVHLTPGTAPTARVHGDLVTLPFEILADDAIGGMYGGLLSADQIRVVDATGAVDLCFDLPHGGRCRAHLFRQRNSYAAAFRILPSALPERIELENETWTTHVAALRRGLVLIAGATGSGKSTTLATILDRINRERCVHIVTIEDPIEYIHEPRRARITQRELHADATTFAEALRSVLRQDPDVVLIGEIRDRATMEAALTVAETGHLVLSSLHAGSAVQAIHRVLDMFPPQDQGPIRAQLAVVLEVVACQQLLPRADRNGRVVAAEVLRVSAALRNLIREGKTHQLDNMMQLNQSQSGTRTMLQAIARLHERGLIRLEDALAHAHDADALTNLLQPASATTRRGLPEQG